jgi:hypothetical protein
MPGHLENKMSIAALQQELTCRGPSNRESAEDEWPRTESEILLPPVRALNGPTGDVWLVFVGQDNEEPWRYNDGTILTW